MFVQYVESEAKKVVVRESSWERCFCVFLRPGGFGALRVQRKYIIRTEEMLRIVFGTLDALRAADYVLVSEATRIHAPSPEPARALQLWVVLEFDGAGILSPLLPKVQVCSKIRRLECRSTLWLVSVQSRREQCCKSGGSARSTCI